jgi:hypothetical protein
MVEIIDNLCKPVIEKSFKRMPKDNLCLCKNRTKKEREKEAKFHL